MRWMMLALALSLPQIAAAGEAELDASLKRLAEMNGFQCRFEQQLVYADGSHQSFSGELAVRRPGMFRWQYHQPYEQLYVGDGRLIWHYEPDLMQAEKLSGLDAVDPVVMRLLNGRLRPEDVKLLQSGKSDGHRRYQVQWSDAPPVWLEFDGQRNLRLVERKDVLGNINRMHLLDCTRLAPSRNLFSFTPPEGVDVVDLRPATDHPQDEP